MLHLVLYIMEISSGFGSWRRGGAGYLNSNNEVFPQQVGPVRLLRNCLNSFGI
jgi:hypothetical protein